MPEVLFTGPAGRLEGRYSPGKSPSAPIALVLHPHPQHGGTMNNKVVYNMYQQFVERDFATLRFNFRGIGKSQGSYDRGEGELADAASALDWLQALNPNCRSVWISGFSFGSWIGMQLLMRRPEIDTFISIAPPASLLDFNFLAPCPTSGLIVHGGADTLVPEASVSKLVQKLSHQRGITIDYRLIPSATHFFTEHMPDLMGHVGSYLDQSLHQSRMASAAA
jgi:alpha/beta superfamily hydrolase